MDFVNTLEKALNFNPPKDKYKFISYVIIFLY